MWTVLSWTVGSVLPSSITVSSSISVTRFVVVIHRSFFSVTLFVNSVGDRSSLGGVVDSSFSYDSYGTTPFVFTVSVVPPVSTTSPFIEISSTLLK